MPAGKPEVCLRPKLYQKYLTNATVTAVIVVVVVYWELLRVLCIQQSLPIMSDA